MIKNTVLPVGASVVLGVREAEGWTVAGPALVAPRAAVGVLAGPEFVAGAFPHPPPPTTMTPVTRTRIHRSRRCDIFSSSCQSASKQMWVFPAVGQLPRACCSCAANSPFVHILVCFACANAHAKHTKTCITTCGRRRRPTCTEPLPLQLP